MIEPTVDDIGRNVVPVKKRKPPFGYAKITQIGVGRLAGYVVVMTDAGNTMSIMCRDVDWKTDV